MKAKKTREKEIHRLKGFLVAAENPNGIPDGNPSRTGFGYASAAGAAIVD